MANATVEEIARGISQVMADSYDGALDKDGKPEKTPLKRGAYDAKIRDKRVNDGFGLNLSGNRLIINYEGEVSLKEIHSKDFEGDTEQMLADVLKYVKKKYKEVTGNTLKCKPTGEPRILVQSTSAVHTWVEAQMCYELQGMTEASMLEDSGEELVSKSIKDWIKLGKGSRGW